MRKNDKDFNEILDWLRNQDKIYTSKQIKLIKRLFLIKKGIKEIPTSFSKLVSLKSLYLNDNEIRLIPQPITQLIGLEYLQLGNNGISDIPTSITNLKSLRGLYLQDNNIRVVPYDINQLMNIEELNLGSNQISELPNINNLKNIKILNLNNNQISELPASLCQKLIDNDGLISAGNNNFKKNKEGDYILAVTNGFEYTTNNEYPLIKGFNQNEFCKLSKKKL